MNKVYVGYMESPVGELAISSSEEGLCGIWFGKDDEMYQWLNRYFDIVEESCEYNVYIMDQLNKYFKKEIKDFDVKLHIIGTEFQKSVWKELIQIPYGKTASYKDISIKIGTPNGARGVGGAVGANKIPIIIPCHRIIGSNRELTGFSGGIEKKIKLLEHEGFSVKGDKVGTGDRGKDKR